MLLLLLFGGGVAVDSSAATGRGGLVRFRMPANRALVEQAVLGFQLVMNDVEQAPIAIHLSLSPSRTPLFHLHPPVNGEDGTQDVETPAGQRHFVDLHIRIITAGQKHRGKSKQEWSTIVFKQRRFSNMYTRRRRSSSSTHTTENVLKFDFDLACGGGGGTLDGNFGLTSSIIYLEWAGEMRDGNEFRSL